MRYYHRIGLVAGLDGWDPDCVVTYSDTHLLSVTRALRERGHEVALASFDNTHLSADLSPAVTSVDHQRGTVGGAGRVAAAGAAGRPRGSVPASHHPGRLGGARPPPPLVEPLGFAGAPQRAPAD